MAMISPPSNLMSLLARVGPIDVSDLQQWWGNQAIYIAFVSFSGGK